MQADAPAQRENSKSEEDSNATQPRSDFGLAHARTSVLSWVFFLTQKNKKQAEGGSDANAERESIERVYM